MILGWGGLGRNRVYDENGREITITDGLGSLYMESMASRARFTIWYALDGTHITRINGETNLATVSTRDCGNLVGLVTLVCISTIDSLPNAMIIPIFVAASGTCILFQALTSQNHIVLLKN